MIICEVNLCSFVVMIGASQAFGVGIGNVLLSYQPYLSYVNIVYVKSIV